MLIIVSDGVSGDDRQDGGQLMSGAIFTATPSLVRVWQGKAAAITTESSHRPLS